LGLTPEAAARGLEALTRVPGRLERVPSALPFRVFVDYAHTEESLRSLLTTARGFTGGRILLAFGCGGDRDRGKRPRMGAVAQALADVVVVTSDNPRSEDPLAILDEIRAGMTGSYRVEADRAAAIRLLLKEARQGDTVLLAGKGHERGQVFADRTLPFDDREEALKALSDLEG
jgi:UDP-N-acetylmuramoyl-L-alanyl-D-glutamate--2,6-diaminopimelate ligase